MTPALAVSERLCYFSWPVLLLFFLSWGWNCLNNLNTLSFSDQTDPFNRSPLTMDQIRPNTELKEKIQRWLAERKKQKEELEESLN